jgi:glycosyltransferase involved in cell wall biosynthesis
LISVTPRHRKIVWSRNMILDVDLFAKTETEVLKNLSKHGYEIFFISCNSLRDPEFKDLDIHLFTIPVGKNNFPLKYHLIIALVQLFSFPFFVLKVKPNFIIVDWDSLFGLMPMIPFCRLLGAKVILDIRSTPTPIQNSNQKAGLRSNAISLAFNASVFIAKKKLDGITIITDLMKKDICSKYFINPNNVGVWSSGVSVELFLNEDYINHGVELRQKLGLTDKFIVFYHGVFTQSRGLIDAINAMSTTKNRYPNVVLFLLGKGSAQTIGDMRKAIQDNGLQDRVILYNSVDYAEVPKYIAMCDVGLVPLLDLPQWRNQCPLKLLEYLAMKKAVILSDIPCHREVVGNDKCGIYLSSISPDGIAESIAFVLDNKEKLEEWGAKGRAIVTNNYTWQRIAKNLDDYLRYIENK